MTMTRSIRIAAVSVLALALVGCGAISGLIPDQTVTNPLKLQGTSHPLVVSGSAASLDKSFGPFENIGDLPLDPKRMKIDQALGTTVVLTGQAVNPPTITLTNTSITITISDANEQTATLGPVVIPGPVTLTQTGGGSYAFTGTPPSFPTIDSGGNTGRVLSILQEGGQNTVSTRISTTASSSPALQNGSALTLTMGAETARLSF